MICYMTVSYTHLDVYKRQGQFRVDTEKSEVTVTVLPFQGWPAVVWTQDFNGKRKNFVAPAHLTLSLIHI